MMSGILRRAVRALGHPVPYIDHVGFGLVFGALVVIAAYTWLPDYAINPVLVTVAVVALARWAAVRQVDRDAEHGDDPEARDDRDA
jgi:hypothetical protein